jgi:hypothetical protein
LERPRLQFITSGNGPTPSIGNIPEHRLAVSPGYSEGPDPALVMAHATARKTHGPGKAGWARSLAQWLRGGPTVPNMEQAGELTLAQPDDRPAMDWRVPRFGPVRGTPAPPRSGRCAGGCRRERRRACQRMDGVQSQRPAGFEAARTGQRPRARRLEPRQLTAECYRRRAAYTLAAGRRGGQAPAGAPACAWASRAPARTRCRDRGACQRWVGTTLGARGPQPDAALPIFVDVVRPHPWSNGVGVSAPTVGGPSSRACWR